MLKPYDIPQCILEAMQGHNLTDADYYLYGCGRALGFIRMAADALDGLDNEQKIAEYHTYAGVSSARTALDASANWLNVHFGIYPKPSILVDFAKPKFREKVPQKPKLSSYVENLGELAIVIDKQRQRAQHREGLGLWYFSSGGWHLAEPAIRKNQWVRIDNLLREWADKIEEQVCQIIKVLHT